MTSQFSCDERPVHVPCVGEGRCHGWPWLTELSGVALTSFTLSGL